MNFKDHFSQQASDYSRYRPCYPEALFAYLTSCVKRSERVWDCGTGSGQAALGLAGFFAEVIGSDASQRQLAHAAYHERVVYVIMLAEESSLKPRSMDLVTVAQALHWFSLTRFYAEVRRVLRPDGILAVWCYGLPRISPAVDKVVKRLYEDLVGSFWPSERKWIEEGYRTLPFAFPEWEPPRFEMEACWNLEHFRGYLGTWSAVRGYRHAYASDPVELIRDELALAWGGHAVVQRVRWPIYLRVGRCTA